MELKENEEIIGNLSELKEDDYYFILKITIEHNIKIPKNKILIQKLKKLINKKIAIIRIDDEYRIR